VKLEPITSKKDIHLDDAHAKGKGKAKDEAELEEECDVETARISELQRVLYADARYALLVVLQGATPPARTARSGTCSPP
jgi:hypothetical protein